MLIIGVGFQMGGLHFMFKIINKMRSGREVPPSVHHEWQLPPLQLLQPDRKDDILRHPEFRKKKTI